ncbi:TetR/AcrR family transcriptional regulator [Paenibacillus sacheonensis]|uniref:TetR family transcriptional regulator n=1 Tax=Paenibacillus sacheonensis TaxID=742054 RepID=A0A7X4YQ97_9BACL|nr:TetR/AcrR family transcriptional regulator [Paenibacillus sacheonensis]MBM7566323.1 AcrR family transcriptional regulator [Paenibacillus sacheonensis]NBC70527.1 TetR family transcriptional regulator [Paenibacillus sacheonensis]
MELRNKIMDAAEQVILTSGLSKTTTKEIARIAGCSEGSLYNHFKSKEDLFLQVMKKHLEGFLAVLFKLNGNRGKRTVKENLHEVARAALDYFLLSIFLTSSLFTEPSFLARHREGFQERNEGPHRANEIVSGYIRAEQKLGRVNDDANPRSAADLLLGACFQHAFHVQFIGEDEAEEARNLFVDQLLSTMMKGLAS